MAKGSAGRSIGVALALIGGISLVVAYSLVTGWNPLPKVENWVKDRTVRELSRPPTAWTARAGDAPRSAAVFDRVIVVTNEGSVDGFNPANGARLWSFPAKWSAAAGGATPVVLVGRPERPGFDVYDATSGAPLWHRDDSEAVWPYQDMVLTLRCAEQFDCQLTARSPTGGGPIWRASINGGQALRGLRPALAVLAPVDNGYAAPITAASAPAPPVIGLPIDNDMVAVSTASGRILSRFHRTITARMVVAAGVVVESTVQARGDVCYPTVEGRDPFGGVIWRRPGYDARTETALGCEQKGDPIGGGGAVVAADPTGRDVVLDAQTGNVAFRAPLGDRVVATDGRVAVVRTANHKTLYGVDLANGRGTWSRSADPHANAGVVAGRVLIADDTAQRLVALAPSGATVLDVSSGATVLGVGTGKVVLSVGRTLGPLSLR
jgi:outer membrane protein assembly factor BamB